MINNNYKKLNQGNLLIIFILNMVICLGFLFGMYLVPYILFR